MAELQANLAPDPSLSAEGTQSKKEADGFPLASNSHRTCRAVMYMRQATIQVTKGEGYVHPILLLNNLVIALLEVGNFLVFVIDRNDPWHGGGSPSQPGGRGDRWRALESDPLS